MDPRYSLDQERLDYIREGFLKHELPEHMWYGLELYLRMGINPGGFMQALLCNDLMNAFSRADSLNIEKMENWIKFIYNYLPLSCYGNRWDYDTWVEKHKDAEFGEDH